MEIFNIGISMTFPHMVKVKFPLSNMLDIHMTITHIHL